VDRCDGKGQDGRACPCSALHAWLLIACKKHLSLSANSSQLTAIPRAES
jgi:hypothetical protein